MKFLINKQEVEEVKFYESFYFTSLAVEKTNLSLVYVRGLAEILLNKEEMDRMNVVVAKFYTQAHFSLANPQLVAGTLYEVDTTEEEKETT